MSRGANKLEAPPRLSNALPDTGHLLEFRVCVDKDLCQGHAVCAGEAPEIFELGPDERVHVKDENPRRELRRKAELAARYCPNHVITIEDL